MFASPQMTEGKTGKVFIDDACPETLQLLVKYIYTGFVPDGNDMAEHASSLLHLSDKYGLKYLTISCVRHLARTLSTENALKTLVLIDRYASKYKCKYKENVIAFIKDHTASLVRSEDWKKFLRDCPDLAGEVFLYAATS